MVNWLRHQEGPTNVSQFVIIVSQSVVKFDFVVNHFGYLLGQSQYTRPIQEIPVPEYAKQVQFVNIPTNSFKDLVTLLIL